MQGPRKLTSFSENASKGTYVLLKCTHSYVGLNICRLPGRRPSIALNDSVLDSTPNRYA